MIAKVKNQKMRYKRGLFLILSVVFSCSALAQLPSKVGGLISVDKTAANLSKSEGPYAGLKYMTDKETTF